VAWWWTAAVVGMRRTCREACEKPGALTSSRLPARHAVQRRRPVRAVGARGGFAAGATSPVVGACVGPASASSTAGPLGRQLRRAVRNPARTAADIVAPIRQPTSPSGAVIGSVSVDGADTPTLAFTSAKGGPATVLRGRSPASPGDRARSGGRPPPRLACDTVEVAGVTGASLAHRSASS
jgi:hypothetical protein